MNSLPSSRRSQLSRFRWVLALCCWALAGMAFAAGDVGGRITGYVYDPTGAPLAEVPLTLHGSLLQGTMTRQTGDDGRFEFNLVPPGNDYVLEVNVPGFTPIRQTGIKVYLGQNTPVDVHLTVLTETQAVQTYEIVEKINPVINPDSAQTGAVVTAEKAAQTPIFHQPEGMPKQVAGTSDSNTPVTRGGLARYGKFYVDGMDTTDIAGGSITAPMNFDSVENFEIITGGFDAQYNALGMVENAVTKSGSNKWTYDVSLTLQPPWMAGANLFPSNQPGPFGNYTNNTSIALPQTSFYSPIINFGGPIIKDKLWFYASGQYNFSHKETSISTAYTPLENRPTDTVTRLFRVKFTYQATSHDRVSLAFHSDHNWINNDQGDSSVTDSGEFKIDRGGYFIIGNYDHSFSDNVLFQLQTGYTYKHNYFGPMNGDAFAVSHNDRTLGVTQFSNGQLPSFATATAGAGNFQDEFKTRFQLDPMLTWKLGGHQMKAGFQFSYLWDKNNIGVTGGQRYVDKGGVCDPSSPATSGFCSQRLDYYNTDGSPNGWGQALTTTGIAETYGAFLQDRWTINRQLTLIPGFRFDLGRLYGTDANGNKFLATTNLYGYGPRLSATYDVTSNRKNLVVFHYGRSNDVGDAFLAQHGNPALTQITQNWNGSSFTNCTPSTFTSGTPLPNCTLTGGPSGRYIAPGQKPPHVDEVQLGLHHANDSETVFGVDLDYRRYSDMWVDEETNRIYDPSGQKVVGYVNPSNPRSVLQAATNGTAYREYKGMDLWVQGTPGNWDLLASYTLSWTTGTVADYFDSYLLDPRMTQFYSGYLPDDQRHAIKGSIAYHTSWGFDLGVRFRYYTGKPLWENFFNPATSSNTLYRSPRGTGFPNNLGTGIPDFNDPSTWSELRNPATFIVDLQGKYDLGTPLHLPMKTEIYLLVVNSLNSGEPTSFIDRYAAGARNTFGTISGHASALQAEVLLRIRNW